MKKHNAFTLIEVLLVLVVIALIMLAGAGQLQRYQTSRNITQAKATVQSLSTTVVDLYLANCFQMQKNKKDYVCPKSVTTTLGSTADSSFCSNVNNLVPVNPFYTYKESGGKNFVIAIRLINPNPPPAFLPQPELMVALPMSRNSSKNQSVLNKYISALQPSRIASSSGYTTPTGQSQGSSSGDACLQGTGQPLCLEWIISPNNWGSITTLSVSNPALANQLQAAATQYVPTKAEISEIQAQTHNQGQSIIQCPGLQGLHTYGTNHQP
ncbi:MAG: prepilin-type N-terminal cleavage/methylation domain-containing protein [Gammaproteobacteria bacterium]|nr:prepilin-type N-terminal cleavage/methylation domain-containing protein [Gammaproteobacteria bacterium]MBY0544651.1 prepilin-type N-terminal cleavage/methylation domain-containing protein [Gammaproteobacteria bacterium]